MEKRRALEAWERKLLSITTGAKSKVVSIGGGGKSRTTPGSGSSTATG